MPKTLNLVKKKGIEVGGLKCSIEEVLGDPLIETRGGFIDGGVYKCDALVKFVNNHGKFIHEKIKLLGTEESLKKMKNGNILLVPSKEE
jgi:hypothetical protein